MKFLYALEIDQGYLAHTPTGTEVPLKIWPKIQRVRLNNFLLVGVSSRDIFQSTPREAGVINCVQFLQRLPQKICDS